MKIEIVLVVLAAGFVGSFLVASAGKVVARQAWPQATGTTRFSPLPLILSLLAGPALFIEAVIREGRLGRLQPAGWALCTIIATGWAACYGVLVLQCAAWVGLLSPVALYGFRLIKAETVFRPLKIWPSGQRFSMVLVCGWRSDQPEAV